MAGEAGRSVLMQVADLSQQALGPDGSVGTVAFLAACSRVLPVVDQLGAAFMMVRSDIHGNISRVDQRAETDPARFAAVFAIAEDEVARGVESDSRSATKGLLWLKRAMEFIIDLLRRLHDDRQLDLPAAATAAYEKTLHPFHGWITSSVFTLAMKVAPSRETFLGKLESSPGRDVMDDIGACTAAFSPVLAAIQKYLAQHGLDDPTKALAHLLVQLLSALALALRARIFALLLAADNWSDDSTGGRKHRRQSAAAGKARRCRLSPPPCDKEPPADSWWRRSAVLLPPQAPHLSGKLTVVLDMDETLVCAYREANLPAGLCSAAAQRAAGAFRLTTKGGATTHPDGEVVVCQRPGLAEFLARASEVAELVVFTAGMPAYASPVLDALDPTGTLFAARLYRGATSRSPCGQRHVKDLTRLGRDMRRVLLVRRVAATIYSIDNNPFSFLANPTNGLPIAPFTGDLGDDHLLASVLPLIEALAEARDVRPHLVDIFDVPAWLATRRRRPVAPHRR